ncbi:ArnT family glycosyltransferase [Polaribacter sp.]|uniref:ArnT family glycosyltransferase n=1 Tax=Polaribacter sp. TaxID=1920175 RepID=UPI003EF69F6B
MKQFVNKNIQILFYTCWFFSLLLQALFTELMYDEAYYWMYSRELSWGYFDHPPAIALLVKIGYSLFNNELGVRLLPMLASVSTIFLWQKIINPKELKVFYLLVLSMGIVHFMGFLALPDNPLLLTSALFFFVYKRFLEKSNLKNALFLGVAAGILILSKYHGVIIIGLTVLSNLKLFRNKYFWLAILPFVAILIPHFLWQFQNDFPSIKYHLFERIVDNYSINYTLEYLGTQPFILGPFTGILFFIAHYKLSSKNQFEKTLQYLFWGGYLFFFIMSFRGRIEAHWTLFIVFPALYFGYNYVIKQTIRKKLYYYFGVISVLLIVAIRILISIDLEKNNTSIVAEITKQFHQKEKMKAIEKQAKDLPVGFMNSYQNASLYEFYSKSKGFSLNNTWGRKNQFDVWNVEQKYRGKKIFLVANYENKKLDSINGFPKIKYAILENLQLFSGIKITSNTMRNTAFMAEEIPVTITLNNNNKEVLNLEANSKYPPSLIYQFFEGKNMVFQKEIQRITNQSLNKEIKFDMQTPDKKGKYTVCFSIMAGWLPPTINSNKYKIEIK